MEIRDYWNIIRKRIWIVLLVAVCVIIGYSIFFFTQEPTYTSKSKIMLRTPSPWNDIRVTSMPGWSTRTRLITTEPVFKGVQKRLRKEGISMSVSEISSGVGVQPSKSTNFVDISFRSRSPERAISVSRLLAKEFLEYDRQNNLSALQNAEKTLKGQIERIGSRLDTVENKLSRYKRRKEIHSPDQQITKGLENIYSLNDRLLEIEFERKSLRNKLKRWNDMLNKNNDIPDTALFGLEKTFIQSVTGELSSARIQLSKLKQELGPKHPKIKEIKGNVKTLKKELEKSIQSHLDNLTLFGNQELRKRIFKTTMQFQVLETKEALVNDRIERIRDRMSRMSKGESKLLEYKREIDLLGKRLKRLQESRDQIEFNKALLDKSVEIIALADSTNEHYPTSYRTYGFVILAGLIFGLSTGGFLEYLNNKVESKFDVHRYLGLPVLGTIPHVDKDDMFLLDLPTKTPLTERYHSISIRLQYSLLRKQNRRSVLVASSIRGEGKTMTLMNLGVSLAREGEKVLLMDLDLRDPHLHRVTESMNSQGLSSILSGELWAEHEIRQIDTDESKPDQFSWDAIDGVVEETSQNGLHLLPSGPVPSNPLELLKSDYLNLLLERAREEYGVLLIDSPPLNSVVDSIVISNECDGVLIVARSGVVSKGQLQHSKHLLKDADSNFLGVVLNDVKYETETYYSYYSKTIESDVSV